MTTRSVDAASNVAATSLLTKAAELVLDKHSKDGSGLGVSSELITVQLAIKGQFARFTGKTGFQESLDEVVSRSTLFADMLSRNAPAGSVDGDPWSEAAQEFGDIIRNVAWTGLSTELKKLTRGEFNQAVAAARAMQKELGVLASKATDVRAKAVLAGLVLAVNFIAGAKTGQVREAPKGPALPSLEPEAVAVAAPGVDIFEINNGRAQRHVQATAQSYLQGLASPASDTKRPDMKRTDMLTSLKPTGRQGRRPPPR